MVKNNPKATPSAEGQADKPKIDFPRNTLKDSIRVAQALEDSNGGLSCPPLDAATAMGFSPGQEEFRALLSSSMRYGLTRGSFNSVRISIEPLGQSIVEPQSPEQVHDAMVNAALSPDVFRKMYESFKNKKLPETQFFQNIVHREFGVPKEWTELCVNNFVANMELVRLVRATPNGKWLSAEYSPTAINSTTNPPVEQRNPNGHDDVTEVQVYPNNQIVSHIENKSQKNEVQASPNNQRVFITHGKNHVIVAQLKDLLSFGKFVPVVAEEHETPSKPVPEKVLDDMRSCFAGVIHVASEDELLDKEGQVYHKINENVLIEIGAAMALYGKNYILLVNKQVHLPSNLQGLYISYYEGEKLDYEATMKLLKAFSEF